MIGAILPAAVIAAFTVGLWGRVTPGVVVSAILVGVALRPPWVRRAVHVHTIPACKAAVVVLWEVLRSNASVIGDVLRPGPSAPGGVVDVALDDAKPGVDTIVSLAATLTPGTSTLDMRRTPGAATVLRIHVLRLDDPGAVRDTVHRFEQLAVAAVTIRHDADTPVPGERSTPGHDATPEVAR